MKILLIGASGQLGGDLLRNNDAHDIVAPDRNALDLANPAQVAETIRALAYEGRHATVGYVDGVLKSEIDIEALHTKRLTLFGVSNRLRTPQQRAVTVRGFAADILPFIAAGKIRPVIDRVFPFSELPAAKSYMESNAHLGKIAVRMDG